MAIINEISFLQTPIKQEFLQAHLHTGYELIFVAKGWVKIAVNSSVYRATAPSVILLNAFEEHTVIETSTDYQRCIIGVENREFDLAMEKRLVYMIKFRPKGFCHVITLPSEDAEKITNILLMMQKENENELTMKEEMLCSGLYALAILIYRNTQNELYVSPSKAFEMQKYIDDNFFKDLSMQEIADHFYMSLSHFSHYFKEETGYSPKEYLIYTRLYHARQYLSNTDYSIAKICELTGYQDLHNFIRQFKQKYGIAPLKFKKQRNE